MRSPPSRATAGPDTEEEIPVAQGVSASFAEALKVDLRIRGSRCGTFRGHPQGVSPASSPRLAALSAETTLFCYDYDKSRALDQSEECRKQYAKPTHAGVR